METVKINIASCDILKEEGSFKTYKVLDTEGNRYGSMEMFEPGEQDVLLEIKGQYKNIKKVKTQKKPFTTQKDYAFEKRKFALEMSQKVTPLPSTLDNFIKAAEQIEAWLNR